jgi:NAD(P)-dependent dehydrogenase (short-subunit alcohol dehydrogenase family)
MARTVIVTGGTGGLGTAVVEAFLDQGDHVVVPWVAEAERERFGERENTTLIQADLFDEQDARKVVEAAGDELHALVNLVGGFAMGQPVADTPFDAFNAQLTLNLQPTYLMSRAAWTALKETRGAIVNVSSRAALKPFATAAGYCTAKAAVITFTQVLAEEGKAHGIRANAVLPSVIETPANREQMGPDAAMVPPAHIASVIRFLCSDDAAPTSGAAIPVYGNA